jgi:hypothetical protein
VCEEIFAIQATGLARRLRQTKSKSAVLGLSGGLDSTLALLVLIEALKLAGMPRSAAVIVTMQNYLAQLGSWVTVVQGLVFVVCVMLFRKGVVGEIANLIKKPL